MANNKPTKRTPSSTRQSLPLTIGAGLYTPGDFARSSPGSSPKIKNCFVRPGPRVEMRTGWLKDTIDPTMWPLTMISYENDTGTETLMSGGGQVGLSAYRKSDGTYTTLSTLYAIEDATNFLNKVYTTYSTQPTDVGSVDSFDGTTLTVNAINASLSGTTINTFNHRLFLGGLHEKQINQVVSGAAYKFEDAPTWTLAGGPPTVTNTGGIRKLTIVGATDTLKTTAAAYTPGASDEYIQVQVDFRAYSTTADLPFTVTVEDATGANIYGTLELLVLNRTVQPDWQRYVFPSAVRIPAATAVYIKYKPGTSTIVAVAGSVDVADQNNSRGLQLTKGRRAYSSSVIGTAFSGVGSYYPYRFVWCEVDDPTYWKASSYYDCKEVAGAITVIRNGNGRLFVFKSNAVWIFNSQDNANLPIVFADLIRNVGCVSPLAIQFFENTFFFVGENEVYAWGGSGAPQPLAGDAMRETLFATATKASVPILEIDQENHELWVYTQTGNIYTFNLATKVWSGPITLTGANDSAVEVSDLIYMKPRGESKREIWASVGTPVESSAIVKLRSTQTQDNITGTLRDVVAEYWFHPIQSLDPKQSVILESVEIDHKITASQTGSTTTAEISFDGGTTFSKAVSVTVSPLASGNYQPMRLDLWQSDERLLVAIKHTGLAGPAYFNMSGASAMVQVCGPAIRANPVTVSSTL